MQPGKKNKKGEVMYRFIKYLSISILLLFVNLSHSQNNELSYYIDLALKNNTHVQSELLNVKKSKELVNQEITLPDPKFSFGYSISPIETRLGPLRAKSSITQSFPWFGTLSAKEDVLISLIKANENSYEQAVRKVQMEVSNYWYDLFKLRNKKLLKEKVLSLQYATLDLLRLKFEQNQVDLIKIIQLQIQIEEMNDEIIQLQNDFDSKLKAFKTYINHPDFKAPDLPDDIKLDTISHVIPEEGIDE